MQKYKKYLAKFPFIIMRFPIDNLFQFAICVPGPILRITTKPGSKPETLGNGVRCFEIGFQWEVIGVRTLCLGGDQGSKIRLGR